MDLYELNKFAGAFLATVLVIFVIGMGVEAFMEADEPEVSGYGEIEGVQRVAAEGEGEPAAAEPLPVLLAAASAEDGEKVARKCVACHSFEAGGPNKVGPNLHNIVGGPVAAVEGFAYSSALESDGGTWGYEELDAFIRNPKESHPGTKMTFAGIKDDAQRADVIMFLRQNTESPPPLPEAPAGEAAAAETPTIADKGVEAADVADDDAPAGPAREDDAGEQQAAAQPAEETPEETGERPAAAQPAEETREDDAGERQAAAQPADAPAPAREEPAATPAVAAPAEDRSPAAAADGAGVLAGLTPEVATRIAAGDAALGKRVSIKCRACHTFDADGANKVGPKLWGVVGRPIAAVEDYNYSDAMAATEGTWTYEFLDAYLANPKEVIPGTKMAFVGLPKPEDRANVILFMRESADEPAPLPAP